MFMMFINSAATYLPVTVKPFPKLTEHEKVEHCVPGLEEGSPERYHVLLKCAHLGKEQIPNRDPQQQGSLLRPQPRWKLHTLAKRTPITYLQLCL